jgi:hypothetical protein
VDARGCDPHANPPTREWDRGKTRDELDDNSLGGIAAPSFVVARDARSNLTPPIDGNSHIPPPAANPYRKTTRDPNSTPCSRRLEKWRNQLEREDADEREKDDRRFRERERRWEAEETERARSRRKRAERDGNNLRDRRRDLADDLEVDEEEKALGMAKGTSRTDVYQALLAN